MLSVGDKSINSDDDKSIKLLVWCFYHHLNYMYLNFCYFLPWFILGRLFSVCYTGHGAAVVQYTSWRSLSHQAINLLYNVHVLSQLTKNVKLCCFLVSLFLNILLFYHHRSCVGIWYCTKLYVIICLVLQQDHSRLQDQYYM